MRNCPLVASIFFDLCSAAVCLSKTFAMNLPFLSQTMLLHVVVVACCCCCPLNCQLFRLTARTKLSLFFLFCEHSEDKKARVFFH